ncbi:MAG: hypothetical protein SAK29_06870 [Scytonema sp. PMC 1069.18]|nr:hypothetical protein [Scytonema sp. PMC 1069.18]MEC4882537.1 hypothetical protein [Scytonema sp. PMC 1070.18]
MNSGENQVNSWISAADLSPDALENTREARVFPLSQTLRLHQERSQQAAPVNNTDQ